LHSRRELVAQIFAQHYRPQAQAGVRIAANGFFAER
jgi:hypothetical protein